VVWIYLAGDSDKWSAPVSTVMQLIVAQNMLDCLVAYTLACREEIRSMEVVRMVLLQCSLVAGTQNLTWMIIMNKITWLMEGFILYNACASPEGEFTLYTLDVHRG
jgi:hypothetical protein